MKYFIVSLFLVILSMYAVIDYQVDTFEGKERNYQDTLEGKERDFQILQSEIGRVNVIVGLFENHYRVPKVYRFVNPIYWEDREEEQLTSPKGYRELLNLNTGGTRTSEHQGVDMAGTWHARLKPISPDGIIEDKWYVPNVALGRRGHKLHGGYVKVRLSDGWLYAYSHMSAIYVREGDVIKDWKIYRNGKYIGEFIGRMGDTGQSDGEHLHLAIQNPEGMFVNPLQYVDMKH